jgi:hypothetical protein
MSSPSRLREYAHPRQLAMSLALEFTHRPHEAIGKQFGGRCRKTVFLCDPGRRAAESEPPRALRLRPSWQDLDAELTRENEESVARNLPILQK